MFKSVLAIMRKAMKTGNTMKTKMTVGTFIIALSFVLGIISLLYGLGDSPYYGSSDYRNDIYDDYLFVNAPESFIDYLNTIDKYSYILYKTETFDVPYDFVTYGQMMRENETGVAVVFEKDCEEKLANEEEIEILTYYLTDHIEYKNSADFIEDSIIPKYNDYLLSINNHPTITIETTKVLAEGTHDDNYDSSIFILIGIIPLLLIIGILYTIMTSATNAIAGEKERGTFAAIVLTPIPRSSIVIGNVLGSSALAVIPCYILTLITFLFTPQKSIVGFIFALLLITSFTLFIASVTILISILNQSVVTAQTAFLPVFLLILAVAVNCIQQLGIFEHAITFFPIYGHFFGIGNALTAAYNYYPNYIPGAICCILISLVFTGVSIYISTRLLYNEKFMTNSGGITADDLRKSKNKRPDLGINELLNHLIFPSAVLSFVQILALVPTAISYMRNDIYSDFIFSLKDVNGFVGIISVMGKIMGLFLSSPIFLLSMAIGYVILITIYCLRIRIFEKNKNPLKSMGFTGTKRHAITSYLVGLLLGFGELTIISLILYLTGNMRFEGIGLNSKNILPFIAGMPMWFVQGAAEEVMFRGFMIPRLKKRFNTIFAVFYSSLLFSILHGANIGFTWLAGINLFIIAVFFALVYLYTDSLWITCATHTAWNFCQGSLYGLEVSGSTSTASVFATSYTDNASAYWTGGSFGPEGGLAVTIVTVIGITIISILLYRKNKMKKA